MDHFAQNPFFYNQSKKVVSVEIFFGLQSAFQPFSSQFGEHRVKERIEDRGKEKENDIAAPKKRTALKSKAAPKKKIAKVKVMEMEFVDRLIYKFFN